MKIVVTGALGHIGSSLIRSLPRDYPEAEIVMLDNLLTERYGSLFELPIHGCYRFIQADILTTDLNEIFKGARVVIHLAAVTNASESFNQRDLVEKINFEGTQRVAEACVRAEARLFFPSTTSVYGKSEGSVDESCLELKPQSPYAESKLKAERMLAEIDGLSYVIGRLGTIFGTSPGMRFHTAINKFCWQAALGEPITVWKTAWEQKRPYLDLKDATRAMSFIIRQDLFDGQIFNVVTTNTTVKKIAEIIQKYAGSLKIEFIEAEIMNQLSYQVKGERFSQLGFEVCGNLDEGIRETLNLLPKMMQVSEGRN